MCADKKKKKHSLAVVKNAVEIAVSMKKTILVSVLSALVLLAAGYYFDRIPWFNGLNIWQLYIANIFKPSYDYDDVMFVNVGNDKEVIPYFSEDEQATIGNQAITDRQKLSELLDVLDQAGGYRYIILDIYFDPNDVTAADSALFNQISKMDRIVVGRGSDDTGTVADIADKSAYVFYYNSMNSTEFTRCLFIDGNNNRFLPLKAYEDINPDKRFESHGFWPLKWYTSSGRLCNNGTFVDFDTREFSRFDDIGPVSTQSYYNMSYDLLENADFSTEAERHEHIADLAKGKYVVIGDFVNDTHDTFVGKRPGPLINYRAFKTLTDGDHLASVISISFWLLVYTITFMLILPKSRHIRIDKLKEKRIFIVFSSFLSISLIFLILSIAEYLITSRVHNITFSLLVFGVTKCAIDLVNSLRTTNPSKS